MHLDFSCDYKTSVHHWQLRHLLKPALNLVPNQDTELSVLFIKDRTVYLTTLKKDTPPPKALLSVDFLPYCFSYSHNFLATAGDSGLLSVFRISPSNMYGDN